MSGEGTEAAGSEWTVRSPAITRKQDVGAEAALTALLAAAALVFWLRRRAEVSSRRGPAPAARSRAPRR